MGQLAYDLGNAYQQTDLPVANSSALFWLLQFPERSLQGAWIEGLTIQGLKKAQDYVQQTISQLPKARMNRPDAALIADEFRLAANLMDHACRLGMARLEATDHAVANIPAQTRDQLASELEGHIQEYRRVWLSRNRTGGLDDSADRIEKLLTLYRG
jgi:hypothetical protein